MLTLLGSIWWLIVTLGVLVTFHEFGHYWVARRCGVKVLRFSVGFGKPIKSWYGKDGTEYCVAWIPLGGYVKMLDAREGEVAEDLKDQEFTGKPLWQRVAVVAAGPAFNLVFAIFAFWVMFMLGRPGMVPIAGTPPPGSLAAQAGLHDGDTLRAIDGHQVATWGGVFDQLGDRILDHAPVRVQVQAADGHERTLTLALQQLPERVDVDQALDKIGLVAQPVPATVAATTAGYPAQQAGLRPGDRILAINGKPVTDFDQVHTRLASLLPADGKGDPVLQLKVQRGPDQLDIALHPVWRDPGDGHGTRWMLGIMAPLRSTVTVHHGPVAALGLALSTTWEKTVTSFSLVGKMLTGQASAKNLGGPITIARAANASAGRGLAWFLSFLGLISLSLAVLNLLPIPILDGGHLLYYLIEFVKGHPVSERAMLAGQFVGMGLLAALMGLVFYNDILRLLS